MKLAVDSVDTKIEMTNKRNRCGAVSYIYKVRKWNRSNMKPLHFTSARSNIFHKASRCTEKRSSYFDSSRRPLQSGLPCDRRFGRTAEQTKTPQ